MKSQREALRTAHRSTLSSAGLSSRGCLDFSVERDQCQKWQEQSAGGIV